MAIFAAIPQAAPAAAAPFAHASVIGGRPASIEELPWIAYISGSDLAGEYSCTGTVVAPRVVLTAGHCVEDVELTDLTPPASFTVATGTANRVRVAKAHLSTVSRALVNPRFNVSRLHGDAALLILAAPVAAPSLPIASAADFALLAPGTPVSIAGWGLTKVEDEDGPALLRSGTNLVQSTAFCRRHSESDPYYSPALQLCAVDLPGRAVSACYGDSGGPAIARRADGTAVQIGITSLGEPECNPESPTVFTRVDRISAWISGWIVPADLAGEAGQLRDLGKGLRPRLLPEQPGRRRVRPPQPDEGEVQGPLAPRPQGLLRRHHQPLRDSGLRRRAQASLHDLLGQPSLPDPESAPEDLPGPQASRLGAAGSTADRARAGSSSTARAPRRQTRRDGGTSRTTSIGRPPRSRKTRSSPNRMPKVWTLAQRGINSPGPTSPARSQLKPSRRTRNPTATGNSRPSTRRLGSSRSRAGGGAVSSQPISR
jgi:hypothetical protein